MLQRRMINMQDLVPQHLRSLLSGTLPITLAETEIKQEESSELKEPTSSKVTNKRLELINQLKKENKQLPTSFEFRSFWDINHNVDIRNINLSSTNLNLLFGDLSDEWKKHCYQEDEYYERDSKEKDVCFVVGNPSLLQLITPGSYLPKTLRSREELSSIGIENYEEYVEGYHREKAQLPSLYTQPDPTWEKTKFDSGLSYRKTSFENYRDCNVEYSSSENLYTVQTSSWSPGSFPVERTFRHPYELLEFTNSVSFPTENELERYIQVYLNPKLQNFKFEIPKHAITSTAFEIFRDYDMNPRFENARISSTLYGVITALIDTHIHENYDKEELQILLEQVSKHKREKVSFTNFSYYDNDFSNTYIFNYKGNLLDIKENERVSDRFILIGFTESKVYNNVPIFFDTKNDRFDVTFLIKDKQSFDTV